MTQLETPANNQSVNSENLWRLQTPGSDTWERSPRVDARRKYFMISCDTHLSPPLGLFKERIDRQFAERLPRLIVDDAGKKYIQMEGARPELIREVPMEGEDQLRQKAGGASSKAEVLEAHKLANGGTAESSNWFKEIEKRLADQARDGVDGELIFPNGAALLLWSSNDPEFVQAQARVWNDWAIEATAAHKDKCNVAAAIGTADVGSAVAEVQRIAKLGYRVVNLPCKPVWGAHDIAHINYNLPVFDQLWAAIQDTDLTITFHVSTGRDPRSARGNGGAVINYVAHALSPTIEPVVSLCSSGMFERFPRIRFATIEANAGWVPWMLDMMDEAYKKHHFWARPRMAALPSDYYRTHGGASLGEDRSAIALVEQYQLVDNFMWANDYPHHEGTWPHSAESIERTMGRLSDDSRAKILGFNAARMFRFEIPAQYATDSKLLSA